MKHDRVPVPPRVMEGLEAIRLSGKTNMLDIQMVVDLALDMGFTQAAMWVRDNRGLYTQGIFRGFEPKDSPEKGGAEECAVKLCEASHKQSYVE